MRQFSAGIMTLLFGCIIFLSIGCSGVTTKYPLSDNPKPIDQDKFEGAWLMDNKVFHLKFASNGVAQISGVKWENDQFQLVHVEMIITKGDKHNFLSVRIQEDGKWMDDYYLLSYMFSENGDLVVWSPNVDIFKNLVEKNHLQGVVTGDKYSTNVSITNAPVRFLKLINDPENLTLFNYTKPTIIRKIN